MSLEFYFGCSECVTCILFVFKLEILAISRHCLSLRPIRTVKLSSEQFICEKLVVYVGTSYKILGYIYVAGQDIL